MDQPAPVELGDDVGETDGEGQEQLQPHRLTEECRQKLATRILHHQCGPAALLAKPQRPSGPGGVQFLPQPVFVGQAIESGRTWMLCGGQHGQNGAAAAVGVQPPFPAEDAFAVLPQDLGSAISVSADLRGQVHLPNP